MPVKIILKEDIDTLGKAGDLVNVKPGYARNYLIPAGLGVIATLQNLTWLKEHRQKLQEEAAEKRKEAEALKEILEALGEVNVAVPVGPTGQLFGRISSQTVADKIAELSGNKLVLNRKAINIQGHPHGVDELGSYSVIVNFGTAVKGNTNLVVSEAQA
jgi:large subunit ribosomal protein L9